MDNVFIIHGGLRRQSTDEWMGALRYFLEKLRFKVSIFTWSGIPSKSEIAKESKNFIDFYNKNSQDKNFIIAKSLGCDICNNTLDSIHPKKIIYNCPTFLVSNKIVDAEIVTAIFLDRDKFVNFWNPFFNFKDHNMDFANKMEMKHSKSVNHHTVNQNILINIDNIEIHLYDLYVRILCDD